MLQGNHKTKSKEYANWNDDLLEPVREELVPVFINVMMGTRTDLEKAEWEINSVMDYITSQMQGL
jgi:hypothetical protein